MNSEIAPTMLDQSPMATRAAPRLQRVRGRAAVGFGSVAGETRLRDLSQAGSAKALLPATGQGTEVVFLNTAGGVTGGDRLEFALTLAEGTQATGTTQTAERAYASPGGAPGAVDVDISVGRGAALDWLPQETILFENSDLERTTRIELAADARLLMCESLVLGRAAMGEQVTQARLLDRREVRRAGNLVWLDPVAFRPGALPFGAAGLGPARAFATVAMLTQGAEDAAASVRTELAGQEADCAVSGWDGRLVLRIQATDGWPMRRALVAALTHLRGHALPRVWQV